MVPTKFATAYRDGETGEPRFCGWWMWFGRCFKVQHTAI
jgi:hypothetical protein